MEMLKFGESTVILQPSSESIYHKSIDSSPHMSKYWVILKGVAVEYV